MRISGLGEAGEDLETAPARRRPRLDDPPDLLVERPDRHRHGRPRRLVEPPELVEVAEDERRLREERERIPEVCERAR